MTSNNEVEELEELIVDFLGAISNNPDTSNYIGREDDENIAAFLKAIQELIDKKVAEARELAKWQGKAEMFNELWQIASENMEDPEAPTILITRLADMKDEIQTRISELKATKETTE